MERRETTSACLESEIVNPDYFSLLQKNSLSRETTFSNIGFPKDIIRTPDFQNNRKTSYLSNTKRDCVVVMDHLGPDLGRRDLEQECGEPLPLSKALAREPSNSLFSIGAKHPTFLVA